jgi:hypothetical protein
MKMEPGIEWAVQTLTNPDEDTVFSGKGRLDALGRIHPEGVYKALYSLRAIASERKDSVQIFAMTENDGLNDQVDLHLLMQVSRAALLDFAAGLFAGALDGTI